MTIYYDHSSSNTGEQRAWIECEKCRQERRDRAEEKTHPACFKYVTRWLFPNETRMAVYLAAWSMLGMQPGFEKYGVNGHKTLVVSSAIVDDMELSIPELPNTLG